METRANNACSGLVEGGGFEPADVVKSESSNKTLTSQLKTLCYNIEAGLE